MISHSHQTNRRNDLYQRTRSSGCCEYSTLTDDATRSQSYAAFRVPSCTTSQSYIRWKICPYVYAYKADLLYSLIPYLQFTYLLRCIGSTKSILVVLS